MVRHVDKCFTVFHNVFGTQLESSNGCTVCLLHAPPFISIYQLFSQRSAVQEALDQQGPSVNEALMHDGVI